MRLEYYLSDPDNVKALSDSADKQDNKIIGSTVKLPKFILNQSKSPLNKGQKIKNGEGNGI